MKILCLRSPYHFDRSCSQGVYCDRTNRSRSPRSRGIWGKIGQKQPTPQALAIRPTRTSRIKLFFHSARVSDSHIDCVENICELYSRRKT
ncbi:hypothetical protein M9435_004350 [Picochlorum sp. BPE23]|nr:hypothetical protein M9435_004350 [Picochlorum sp. BPE23]